MVRGATTIAGGEERESNGVVVKASVVSGGGEQENSHVVQKESAEHGGEVLKFGEEKEVPLVLALDVDAALLPVEAQPKKPVFGDAVPVGLWKENSHSALRKRLQHLIPERKEKMFQRLWKYPRIFGQAPRLTTWAVYDIYVGNATPVKLPPY